jgi:hypothetical protein
MRQTAAAGLCPQGLVRRKWLSGHGKRHLSTEKAAFYYYDYVFIEVLINITIGELHRRLWPHGR